MRNINYMSAYSLLMPKNKNKKNNSIIWHNKNIAFICFVYFLINVKINPLRIQRTILPAGHLVVTG